MYLTNTLVNFGGTEIELSCKGNQTEPSLFNLFKNVRVKIYYFKNTSANDRWEKDQACLNVQMKTGHPQENCLSIQIHRNERTSILGAVGLLGGGVLGLQIAAIKNKIINRQFP